MRTGLFTDSNGVRVEIHIEELLNLQQTLNQIDGTNLHTFITQVHNELKVKFNHAYL
ncbi:hypothetical protein P4V41_07900 [Fictibacillus nanhaiensis]|uniref:hypothetical protein n=1 Tax=Fictibacillus nanhaiensis TaxID=742169 RepID=UPI002E23192A|nr:hypothetical protein [Fictibacillus nanhaiensis]